MVWEKLRRRGALRARSRQCRVDWGRISDGTRADSASAAAAWPVRLVSTNQSVRAAARTRRKVLAPTTRSRLRHWSCPKPGKGIAITDGDFHGPPLAILREDRFETQREVGGEKRLHRRQRFALAWACGTRRGGGRRTTTTRISAPAERYATAPSTLGRAPRLRWDGAASRERLRAKVFGDPSNGPFFGGQPRRGVARRGGSA